MSVGQMCLSDMNEAPGQELKRNVFVVYLVLCIREAFSPFLLPTAYADELTANVPSTGDTLLASSLKLVFSSCQINQSFSLVRLMKPAII